MKKLFSGIKWFEDTLTSAFLSIVVLITLANVVARYVMKSSSPWAQEISGFFWTWTVMIGMSVGYRRNLHYGSNENVLDLGSTLEMRGKGERASERKLLPL